VSNKAGDVSWIVLAVIAVYRFRKVAQPHWYRLCLLFLHIAWAGGIAARQA
jgi:hypothetical protein